MIRTRLHAILGERRMSMKALERASGVSYPQIHRIYHGKSTAISFGVLSGFCQALDCQPGDLLEYVPDNPEA